MILIFGGAYQGKLDYALEKFNIHEDEVYTCPTDRAELTEASKEAKVIDKLEDFCWACIKEGGAVSKAGTVNPIEAKDYLESHKELWQNKILISRDVSQGLVPMNKDERAYREMMGRMLVYLTGEADEVYRIFAGFGQKIK